MKINAEFFILAAAILWGTTGTAQAFAPESANPVAIAATRGVIGGLTLFLIALLKGEYKSIRQINKNLILISAVFTAAYQPLFFTGVSRTGIALSFSFKRCNTGGINREKRQGVCLWSSLFSSDKVFIETGIQAVRIVLCAIPVVMIQIVGAGIYQSFGKPKEAIIIALSNDILFLIPISFLLSQFFGLIGVWIAFPVTDVMSALLTAWFLRKEES